MEVTYLQLPSGLSDSTGLSWALDYDASELVLLPAAVSDCLTHQCSLGIAGL